MWLQTVVNHWVDREKECIHMVILQFSSHKFILKSNRSANNTKISDSLKTIVAKQLKFKRDNRFIHMVILHSNRQADANKIKGYGVQQQTPEKQKKYDHR